MTGENKMSKEIQNNLRLVQLKCVEIVKEINRICLKYNIEYSLCGGSVIGAYLYKGFIPWDDDIDIMMTRSNYNKFIVVAKNELKNSYRLLEGSPQKKTMFFFLK